MNNRFYVYVYLDQRKRGKWTYEDKVFDYQPFYVGKGTRQRDIEHLCPYMLSRKSHKSSTIKAIISETGELPIHFRLYENMSPEEATEIEVDFIRTFGRRDIGSGILCNHTDGGDGSHNLSLESRRKINAERKKSVYQYSLTGYFIRKWKSLTDVGETMAINQANISTAIKRGGSCYGFLWSYTYLGKKIESKMRYQMPVKYTSIIQLDKCDGRVIMTYDNALAAETALNLRKGARNKIYDCMSGKLKTAYGFVWRKSI
jgi:hypothetical protein